MLVALKDYYPIYLEGESDGIRENGNLELIELIKKGKEKNIYFEIYNKKMHKKYDLVIFCNEQRLNVIIGFLLRNLFVKKIKLFYMADETPISRPRYSLIFPQIYNKILINSIDFEKYNGKDNYIIYTSASIPDKKEILKNKNIILKNRKNLLCYIGANKLCLNKKSTYIFRNKFIRLLSKHKNFSLYGKFWDEVKIPIDFPFLSVVIRIKFLKNFVKKIYRKRYPAIQNKGSVESKLETMSKYKFSLAIEPFIGEPRMVLEKIFDPMLVGSIPIYYGNKIKEIPDDIYIRINKETNADELIDLLESIPEEDLIKYRERIFEFLISDRARKFRFSYFANKIINALID